MVDDYRGRGPARREVLFVGGLILLLGGGAAQADLQGEAYEAMGLEVGKVITGTVLTSQVVPGRSKQVVALTTYFTGKRERDDAVSVRLDVFQRGGEELISIFSRDFGAEVGGLVGEGDLQVIDLDRDGVNEIIVAYDDYTSQVVEQRNGEVVFWDDGAFVSGWSGKLAYDATRAAREVPVERRDRFEREFDFANTMRTRGVTLFFTKTVIAVAGERLPEPKLIQETFPLKKPS